MKLFVWTENEYEACNHKIVFAESVDEARQMVVDGIRKFWTETPRDPWETESWIEEHCENEIQSFLTDHKWSVNEYDITPGVALSL